MEAKYCVQDAKNVFAKYQKHFLLSRYKFCVLKVCCVKAQTRKHVGNTEETLTECFPIVLRTQATYFEGAEFASRKQKMFCFLLACSPMQQCEH